jgi:hypothetical protein
MNCRVITHGVTHDGGPSNVEIYNNTIQENDATGQGCFRCIHHQGSNTMMVGNNSLHTTSAKDSDPMALLHYRDYWFAANGPGTVCGAGPDGFSLDCGDNPCDGTDAEDGNRTPGTSWYGYPCFRQPGRDTTGAYKPIYVWNNFWSDTLAKIDLNFDDQGGTTTTGTPAGTNCTHSNGGTCAYSAYHIVSDREYFNAVSASANSSPTSPFNGTTGAGCGTMSNRPATCTTSTEAGAGVGYFATDVGPQGTGGGTLFTCSATNTWSAYWVEYQYPHPLEGFAIYPTILPGAGTYGSTQTVTMSNPNASGVVCYTVNGTTPATNGDGATCATGTAFTTSSTNVSVSTTETLKAIAGTSTASDSQVNQQPFTISGSSPVAPAPALGLFAENHGSSNSGNNSIGASPTSTLFDLALPVSKIGRHV